jgi:hypothetical protein
MAKVHLAGIAGYKIPAYGKDNEHIRKNQHAQYIRLVYKYRNEKQEHKENQSYQPARYGYDIAPKISKKST